MEDWEVIVKYINEEASQEERQKLELWLNEHSDNKLLFNKIKATWDASAELNQDKTFDKQNAWEAIQDKISKEEKVIPLRSEKKSVNAWILRVAAVLVIGLLGVWVSKTLNAKPELILVSTSTEQKTVTLPDGSKITINKNSQLKYPKVFDDTERHIELSGQAFFEVTKDAQKPFVIHHTNFDIKVLGTSFDVKAYDKDNETKVTVITGKVAFSDKYSHSVILEKGEQGVLDISKKSLAKTNDVSDNVLAWKSKTLQFNNTTIKELRECLIQYFDADINIENPALMNCRFTGSFVNPELSEILKALEITLNLKIAVDRNHVSISGKGC